MFTIAGGIILGIVGFWVVMQLIYLIASCFEENRGK
jgi:hypothetical protein